MATLAATCPFPPGSGKPAHATPPATSSSLAVSPGGTKVFATGSSEGAGSAGYATVAYTR